MKKAGNKIERSEYLDWLKSWKDQPLIKVVSGVRRCGKSTLFQIYGEYLLESGVNSEQIISINFEDIDFEELTDYRLLYKHLKERLLPNKMNYIFLDEIQHVKDFEKAVDSLLLKENTDIYITGSNAYFMSGELATLLTGRFVELKMLPLSFKEFCEGMDDGKGCSVQELFNLYIEIGSFPYCLRFSNAENEHNNYLRDLYSSILINDVVARLRVSDIMMLESVTKFILHNIGNIFSITKIANTMKSSGRSIDNKTIERYLNGLESSLLIYRVGRYNIKGKQFLSTQGKYYSVDIGMRNTMVRGRDSDIGHILENIVYLELLRRGNEVYVGHLEGGEVDFVAMKNGAITYYQVSASTLDENTLNRELAPLRNTKDDFPKVLITLDEVFKNANYDGIIKVNAIDWLLE